MAHADYDPASLRQRDGAGIVDINLPTLMVAASFVAGASGVFLICAWLLDRTARAPLLWGLANLVLAIGVPLLASPGAAFGLPSTILGIILLDVSPALIWSAARSCNQRSFSPALVAAGIVIWLAAFVTGFRLPPDAQMSLCFGLAAAYLFAAALELWFGRSERIQARWPLIVLLMIHAIFFAGGAVAASISGFSAVEATRLDNWFGLIHFETLAFVVGTAIFAVAMVKEKRELEQITAARIDPLTGVLNRRAFLETATALLDRHMVNEVPLSLVVFDLDRFKSINDGFGHAAGDRVLEQFGRAARGAIRGSDVVGRPGGEEFAVVLPGSSPGAAFLVAERIRDAFVAGCASLGLDGVKATASAGVATAHPDSTLESLFAAADEALYQSKAGGRNMVTLAERDRSNQPVPVVVPKRLAARAA